MLLLLMLLLQEHINLYLKYVDIEFDFFMLYFKSKAPPPDPKKLPNDSDVDVSVILLLALYRNQEFARVGYYVFTEYDDPELRENPPVKVDFEKVRLNDRNSIRKINFDLVKSYDCS